jgi:conjugative relaxase-like TrwC/TraI family protein
MGKFEGMISMTPIEAGDVNKSSREFFGDDFLSYRLGHRGTWQGRGAMQLKLENPVQRDVFEHLLKGRSPEGDRQLTDGSNPVAAWRMTFSGSQSVSVLWALAPKDIQLDIEQAHARATRRNLALVEESLSWLSFLSSVSQ